MDPGGEGFPCESNDPEPHSLVYRCVELPPEGGCEDEAYAAMQDGDDCIGGGRCGGPGFVGIACGPDPGRDDACCYWLIYDDHIVCPGRPFTVDGRERLATARPGEGWVRALDVDIAALSPRERTALADAWTECGLFEHASVASFARFVLQLLAAGAPASLVDAAQQAMHEELEHARAFFGLASAYAGAAIGPGPLRVDGALRDADDLAAVAAAAASEGCIAETISALHVAVAASHARDPLVADLLRRIAEEELRHAELAWTFVAWALHHGPPAVRTAVANVFSTPHRSIPRPAALDDSHPSDLYLAHGLLPASHRAPLTHHALTEIILPAASRLLAAPRGGRPARL